MPVVNIRRGAAHDVYIGRPSIWGNPYSHLIRARSTNKVKDRAEAISKYEEYLRSNKELLARLPELSGKILGCWCKPLPCHGDVLLRVLAEMEGQ